MQNRKHTMLHVLSLLKNSSITHTTHRASVLFVFAALLFAAQAMPALAAGSSDVDTLRKFAQQADINIQKSVDYEAWRAKNAEKTINDNITKLDSLIKEETKQRESLAARVYDIDTTEKRVADAINTSKQYTNDLAARVYDTTTTDAKDAQVLADAQQYTRDYAYDKATIDTAFRNVADQTAEKISSALAEGKQYTDDLKSALAKKIETKELKVNKNATIGNDLTVEDDLHVNDNATIKGNLKLGDIADVEKAIKDNADALATETEHRRAAIANVRSEFAKADAQLIKEANAYTDQLRGDVVAFVNEKDQKLRDDVANADVKVLADANAYTDDKVKNIKGDTLKEAKQYTDKQVSKEAAARKTADAIEAAWRIAADEMEKLERKAADKKLQDNIDKETARAKETEAQINNRVKAAEDRIGTDEARIGAAEDRLGADEARIGAAENRIDAAEDRIGANEARIGAAEDRLGTDEARIGAAENRIDAAEDRIGANEARIGAAEDRIGANEARIGVAENRIYTEEERAKAAEQTLRNSITQETTDRINADAAEAAERSRVDLIHDQGIANNAAAIAQETTDRINADAAEAAERSRVDLIHDQGIANNAAAISTINTTIGDYASVKPIATYATTGNIAGDVKALDSKVEDHEVRITHNEQSIRELQGEIGAHVNEIREVGAISAALAGLHYVEPSGEGDDHFTAAVSYGGYRGSNAEALGLAYKPNPNMMFTASTSISNGNDSQNAYNAGFSIKFGKGETPRTRAELNKQLTSVKEQNKEMLLKIENLSGENAEQGELIREQGEIIKELLNRIEQVEKKK